MKLTTWTAGASGESDYHWIVNNPFGHENAIQHAVNTNLLAYGTDNYGKVMK